MNFDFGNILNLNDLLDKLRTGLTELDLTENTRSFKVDNETIAAGEDLIIRNQLRTIPSQYIIVNQEGNGLVTKSDPSSKAWTKSYLYLKNNGVVDVKVSVLFMR